MPHIKTILRVVFSFLHVCPVGYVSVDLDNWSGLVEISPNTLKRKLKVTSGVDGLWEKLPLFSDYWEKGVSMLVEAS